jgi:hypothetical protein
MIKNLGFLLRNFPFAGRRAEDHLKRSIATSEEMGARGVAGMACLDLGLLHQATGKKEQARDSLTRARQHLEACGAELLLKQVDSVLNSIEGIPRSELSSEG